jgi:hypothetical protein
VVGQGCVYQIGAVAQPNNSNSTQADSGYFWTCDGGLAFFDPASITYDSPNVVNLTWWATGASQGVVKLPYCTPGSLSAGPYSSGSATPPPGAGADCDNLFLGCTPRLNGNTEGSAPGVTVSIAETYTAVVNGLELRLLQHQRDHDCASDQSARRPPPRRSPRASPACAFARRTATRSSPNRARRNGR